MESGERELLRGKLAGIFNKQTIVLTDKRLIVEGRSINLNDVLEVYAKQGRLDSKLAVRLTNGTEEEYQIVPEKVVSALTFLVGDVNAQESEMRSNYRATTDRWVNLINRLLKSDNLTKTDEKTDEESEREREEKRRRRFGY